MVERIKRQRPIFAGLVRRKSLPWRVATLEGEREPYQFFLFDSGVCARSLAPCLRKS